MLNVESTVYKSLTVRKLLILRRTLRISDTLLATALASLTTAAAKMAQSIAPSEAVAIQQMGGAEFFDPAIAEKVTNSIQTNAMTPSVARDFVQNLATRSLSEIDLVERRINKLRRSMCL